MLLKSFPNNILLSFFKPDRWSIGIKILVAILLAAIVPMIVVVNYNLQQSLERIEKSQYNELELLASTKANQLDRLINDRKRELNAIIADSQVSDFLLATDVERQQLNLGLQSVLEKVLYSHPSHEAVYILDLKGRCIASSNPLLLKQNYAFRSYFIQVIEGNSTPVDILFGSETQDTGLYTAEAVRSPENKLLGVAVLKVNRQDVESLINKVEANSPVDTLLVDRYGIIVSHSNPKFLYRSLAPLTKKTQEKIVAQKRYGSRSIDDLGLSKLADLMIGTKQTGHTDYYSTPEEAELTIGFAPWK